MGFDTRILRAETVTLFLLLSVVVVGNPLAIVNPSGYSFSEGAWASISTSSSNRFSTSFPAASIGPVGIATSSVSTSASPAISHTGTRTTTTAPLFNAVAASSTVVVPNTPSSTAVNGFFESGVLSPWTATVSLGTAAVDVVSSAQIPPGGQGSYSARITTSSSILVLAISQPYRLNFPYFTYGSFSFNLPLSGKLAGAAVGASIGSATRWSELFIMDTSWRNLTFSLIPQSQPATTFSILVNVINPTNANLTFYLDSVSLMSTFI